MPRAVNFWPLVGLIFGVALAGVVLISNAAKWADDREAKATRERVGPIFDHLRSELGVAVKDYAWWDDAFEALQVHGSSGWARDNLSEGTVIGRDRAVDGVIVVDAMDGLTFGLWRGSGLESSDLAHISGGLDQLVDAARKAAQGAPVPVDGTLAYEGIVAFAEAAAVIPTNPGLVAEAGTQMPVIVFVRTLSPDYLEKLSQLYDLPGARILQSPVDENVLPLEGSDGNALAYFAWTPSKPGSDLLQSTWLETLIAAVILAAISSLVIRQFITQHKTLRQQVHLIDEGVARVNDTLSKLSNTLQAIDYGIAMYDQDAKLQHWNAAYERLWALPAGFARAGMSAKDVLDHCFQVGGFQLLGAAETGGTASDPYALERSGRWAYRRGDRQIIMARRLTLADGGFLSVSSDVTQQVRHETELIAAKEEALVASRSKSEFLANVSHELRTPLNAIIGFSEILSRELFGPLGSDRYKTYVADIHNSGEHLLSLINDILDLSKIEAGRFKLRLEVFDCVELTQNVIRLIRPRSLENQQVLSLDLPQGSIALNADKRALKQVLINVLSNAVKFTPEGGSIALKCQPMKGGVEFSVSDTGIGIEEKDIELALSPFGQIDSQYSRRHEGTGLGLSIVKGIVTLHGGTLKVESRIGTGTTVKIFVPDQGITGGAADHTPIATAIPRTVAS